MVSGHENSDYESINFKPPLPATKAINGSEKLDPECGGMRMILSR